MYTLSEWQSCWGDCPHVLSFQPSDSCVDAGSPVVACYHHQGFAPAQKNTLAGTFTFIKTSLALAAGTSAPSTSQHTIHLPRAFCCLEPKHGNCTVLLMRWWSMGLFCENALRKWLLTIGLESIHHLRARVAPLSNLQITFSQGVIAPFCALSLGSASLFQAT